MVKAGDHKKKEELKELDEARGCSKIMDEIVDEEKNCSILY